MPAKGLEVQARACQATATLRVHPLRMREDGQRRPPLRCERAACLSRPPLEGALRRDGGGRGEDGMLLACTKDQWSGAWWCRAAPRNLHATGKGEHTMHAIRHGLGVVALSLVV